MTIRSLRGPRCAALLAALLTGCADQGPSLPACTGAVTIAVSAGTHPAFSWAPACRVEGLTVALPGPGAVVWSVEGSSRTNTIAAPVSYGITPSGGRQVLAPIALASGTSYDVLLFRSDDGHGGSIQSAGSTSFTP